MNKDGAAESESRKLAEETITQLCDRAHLIPVTLLDILDKIDR